MAAERVIRTTTDYSKFYRSTNNRCLDLLGHKALKESLKTYGFLPSFPIVVHKNGGQGYEVKDGQHRLHYAEELGLPVHYVVERQYFDISDVNGTQIPWKPIDYANKHAASGLVDYQKVLAFASSYGLQVSFAAAMLAGTISYSNVKKAFRSGRYKITDAAWATLTADTYHYLVTLSKKVKNTRLLQACAMVHRITGFDRERLIKSASRCREKLVPYSTVDAYLDMLEEIYNYRRRDLFPLKINAQQAMRSRTGAITNSRR